MAPGYFMTVLLLLSTFPHIVNATVRYVKPTATGTGEGTDWANASGNLQAMIDSSSANDEVWVMAGTYVPANYPTGCTDCSENRDFSFILKNQVKVYGGFAGNETMLSQRTKAVILANPSVLSGDIGVLNDSTDNVYHVLLSISDDASTLLDGFTVFKGFSVGASGNITIEAKAISRGLGAGMHNRESAVRIRNTSFVDNTGRSGGGVYNNYSDLSFEDCNFLNNNSQFVGGGMRNYSGSVTINNSSFSNNKAFNLSGGGIYSDGNTALTVTNSTFINNNAYSGGAVYHFCTVTSLFQNCTFTGNTADMGAGMFIYWSENITLSSCLFTSNTAGYGGAVYNWLASPEIRHCTFFNNVATENGGAMETRFNYDADLYVTNSVFVGNSAKFGGAVHNYYDIEIHFINCTFTSNEASQNGGAMYNTSGLLGESDPVRAYLRNCVFWNNALNGNSSTPGADLEGNHDNFYQFYVSYSILQLADNNTNYWEATSQGFIRNGYDDGGVANLHATDPLFVNGSDPDGSDDVFGTIDDGIALQNCSPGINKGNNNENTDTTDYPGNNRIENLTIDIGAYENGAVTVTLSANPNTPFCSGTSVTFTAAPMNGGTSPTYDFRVNGVSQQNGTSSTFASNSLNNNEMVTVKMISNLCSFDIPAISDTLTMTVYALPIPSAQNNSPICAGETANFSGSGGISYSWTGPNAFSSSLQNPAFENAHAGLNGIYSLVVTNANSCTASASTSLVIHALPAVSIGNNSPLCVNNTLELTAAGGSSYSWSGPNSYSSNLQNPNISNAQTTLTGTYIVTVSNTNSCTATASTQVTIHSLPVPSAGSNSPICAGATLNLNASGGTSYAWTGPNGFSSGLQNPGLANAPLAASGSYLVTVTDVNSCTATSSILVEVNQAAPEISADPTTVNFGESTTLTATGCAGTIQWSLAGLSSNPLVIKLDNSSSFTATCTVNNCKSLPSNLVSVTVNGNPCQNLVTLTSTANDYTSGTILKMASGTSGKIVATNKVTGSSKVIYNGASVELKPGFKADGGTLFLAESGGCQ